jgi:hypothetical protein
MKPSNSLPIRITYITILAERANLLKDIANDFSTEILYNYFTEKTVFPSLELQNTTNSAFRDGFLFRLDWQDLKMGTSP